MSTKESHLGLHSSNELLLKIWGISRCSYAELQRKLACLNKGFAGHGDGPQLHAADVVDKGRPKGVDVVGMSDKLV